VTYRRPKSYRQCRRHDGMAGRRSKGERCIGGVLPLRATAAGCCSSIWNCTLPVSPLAPVGVTVAVKVTDWRVIEPFWKRRLVRQRRQALSCESSATWLPVKLDRRCRRRRRIVGGRQPEAVYVAILLLSVTGLPTSLPPIWNCTVPVRRRRWLVVTVAVNVTDWPKVAEVLLEVTAVEVVADVAVADSVCVTAATTVELPAPGQPPTDGVVGHRTPVRAAYEARRVAAGQGPAVRRWWRP